MPGASSGSKGKRSPASSIGGGVFLPTTLNVQDYRKAASSSKRPGSSSISGASVSSLYYDPSHPSTPSGGRRRQQLESPPLLGGARGGRAVERPAPSSLARHGRSGGAASSRSQPGSPRVSPPLSPSASSASAAALPAFLSSPSRAELERRRTRARGLTGGAGGASPDTAVGVGGKKKQRRQAAGAGAAGLAAAWERFNAQADAAEATFLDDDDDDGAAIARRCQHQRPAAVSMSPERGAFGSSGGSQSSTGSLSPRGGSSSRALLGAGTHFAVRSSPQHPPPLRSPSERAASPSNDPPPLHGSGAPTSPGPQSCFRLDESGAGLLAGGDRTTSPYPPLFLNASASFGESSGGGVGPILPPRTAAGPLSPRGVVNATGRRSPVAGCASPVRVQWGESLLPRVQDRGPPKPAEEYVWEEEEEEGDNTGEDEVEDSDTPASAASPAAVAAAAHQQQQVRRRQQEWNYPARGGRAAGSEEPWEGKEGGATAVVEKRRAALARLNKEKKATPAAALPAASSSKHYHRQQPRPLPASALDYEGGLRGKVEAVEARAAALDDRLLSPRSGRGWAQQQEEDDEDDEMVGEDARTDLSAFIARSSAQQPAAPAAAARRGARAWEQQERRPRRGRSASVGSSDSDAGGASSRAYGAFAGVFAEGSPPPHSTTPHQLLTEFVRKQPPPPQPSRASAAASTAPAPAPGPELLALLQQPEPQHGGRRQRHGSYHRKVPSDVSSPTAAAAALLRPPSSASAAASERDEDEEEEAVRAAVLPSPSSYPEEEDADASFQQAGNDAGGDVAGLAFSPPPFGDEEDEEGELASASVATSNARFPHLAFEPEEPEEEDGSDGDDDEAALHSRPLPVSSLQQEEAAAHHHHHPSAVTSLRQGSIGAEEEEEAEGYDEKPEMAGRASLPSVSKFEEAGQGAKGLLLESASPPPPSAVLPAEEIEEEGEDEMRAVSLTRALGLEEEQGVKGSVSLAVPPLPLSPTEEEEQEQKGTLAAEPSRLLSAAASSEGEEEEGEEEEEERPAAVAVDATAPLSHPASPSPTLAEAAAAAAVDTSLFSPVPSPPRASSPSAPTVVEEAGDEMAVAALVGPPSPVASSVGEEDDEGEEEAAADLEGEAGVRLAVEVEGKQAAATVVVAAAAPPERGEEARQLELVDVEDEEEGARGDLEGGVDGGVVVEEQQAQQPEEPEQEQAVYVSPYYDIEPMDWRGILHGYLAELFAATDVPTAMAHYLQAHQHGDSDAEEDGVGEGVLPVDLYVRLEQAKLEEEEEEEDAGVDEEARFLAVKANQIHRKACFDAADACLRRIARRYQHAARLFNSCSSQPQPHHGPTQRLPPIAHAVAAGTAARAATRGKRVGAGRWPPLRPLVEEEGDDGEEEEALAPLGHYFDERGRPRLPTAGEALHELLHDLQLSQDHLGQGGGYFDVAAQQAPPMDVSLDMARERARSRKAWARGEGEEERRVREGVVAWLVEELVIDAAVWLAGDLVGEGLN